MGVLFSLFSFNFDHITRQNRRPQFEHFSQYHYSIHHKKRQNCTIYCEMVHIQSRVTLNQRVRGSSPWWITKKNEAPLAGLETVRRGRFFCVVFSARQSAPKGQDSPTRGGISIGSAGMSSAPSPSPTGTSSTASPSNWVIQKITISRMPPPAHCRVEKVSCSQK